MGGKMTNLQFSPEMLDRGALLKALRALRKGEFSVRMPMDLVGIDGEIAQAFNDVVEINEMIAGEFARIGNEVGKEGKTGQRAKLPVATGSWQECVESVNTLIGDLVKKITVDVKGEILELKSTINTMVDQLNAFASEVSRVAREVGTDGKLGGQAQVPGVAGTWKDLTDNVNLMAANLTGQVRNIAEVTT